MEHHTIAKEIATAAALVLLWIALSGALAVLAFEFTDWL